MCCFPTLKRPQALDTAEPLAIPLSSVLVQHRVAVVTPQRSNHETTSLSGAPAHAGRLVFWATLPTAIVA